MKGGLVDVIAEGLVFQTVAWMIVGRSGRGNDEDREGGRYEGAMIAARGGSGCKQ